MYRLSAETTMKPAGIPGASSRNTNFSTKVGLVLSYPVPPSSCTVINSWYLGLFMTVFASLIFITIVTCGIRALASLDVSYGAFSKEMGPAAQKKQQKL